ncbi:hypothetical protein [Actinomadura sp. 9N407]|uniref:hypothetical protein n=1 Tax=Actinomadura sp. 9N407 TaxID=3375154 RepID=UPI00378DABDB
MSRRAGRPRDDRPLRSRDSVPLSHYAGVVRRHRRPLVAMIAIGGLLGLALALLTPKAYLASVTVLAPAVPLHAVEAVKAEEGEEKPKPPEDATVDTEAQLVHTEEVLARLGTLPGFNGLSRSELNSRIVVTVAPHTRVITIGVRAYEPRQAREGAEITAEAYLNLRHEILGGVQQRDRESLQRREKLLEKQLETLPGEAASLSDTVARTRRQAIAKQIEQVRKDLSAIDGKAVTPGEIVRRAALPKRPEDRRRDVSLTTGAGVGLLLGLLFAVWRERRPHRIRTAAGIQVHTRVPVIGTAGPDAAARDDTCRRLRNMIFDERAGSVLVTGAPASAAEPIARQLARLCASGGVTTTFLRIQDEDAPREEWVPINGAGGDTVHVSGGPGTNAGSQTNTDAGDADPDAPARSGRTDRTRPDGLEGICIERTMRLSDGDRGLRGGLDRALRRADMAIITGPALGSVETLTLATLCDLTVVVVEQGSAIDLDVARGIDQLADAAVPARGLILTERAAGTVTRPAPDPVAR